MTLIEHTRLVLEHRLDDVLLAWEGAHTDDVLSVQRITAEAEGGYVIQYLSSLGNVEYVTVGPTCLRDSDVRRFEHSGDEMSVQTMRLTPLSGEAAASLLSDYGINVHQLNERLFSGHQAQYTASTDGYI